MASALWRGAWFPQPRVGPRPPLSPAPLAASLITALLITTLTTAAGDFTAALSAAFATAFATALATALLPVLTLWREPVSALEIVAFVLALLMVVLNMRVNALAWPLAIVSSLLYFALFSNSRLYGEASLQILFVVVALWGWWQWRRGTQSDGSGLRVRELSTSARWGLLVALGVAWPATGWFLQRYTDTDVPWWDAFPTASSLIGQWLLGRQYVENWPVWIVVNIVSVGLFVYKGLWLTALLYSLFVVLSVLGWRAWRRRLPAAQVA